MISDVLAVPGPGGGATPYQKGLIRAVRIHQEQVRRVEGFVGQSAAVAVKNDLLSIWRQGCEEFTIHIIRQPPKVRAVRVHQIDLRRKQRWVGSGIIASAGKREC